MVSYHSVMSKHTCIFAIYDFDWLVRAYKIGCFFFTIECHFETSEELQEELDNVRDGVDYILHLNYKGLEEMPAQILQESAYKHVRRIYMKQNRLTTLVRCCFLHFKTM